MISSPLRAIAIAASALTLAAAAPSFGPPWISIETPPNPYDAASRGAALVVHTFHHADAVASGVTGTAEGIVDGARRSLPLSFDATSRKGSYAVRKQWPAGGVWMLVINTGGQKEGVTALVDLDANGEVGRVRVPTRREGQWELPLQVTSRDITTALEARVATSRTAAR